MLKYIGFEAANSYVKSKSDTKEETYLNTRKVVPRFRENVFGEAGSNKQVYRVNWDPNSYTVGDVDGLSSSSREHKRYGKESYKLESLIAISRHVDTDDTVKAVTGLPGNHYRIQEAKDDIKNQLEGEQIIYVNDKAKVFHIEKVIPVLQPLGSLFYLMLDTNGQYRGDIGAKLARGKKLIVDIGFGSTDIAVLEGFDLVQTEGLNYSMYNAFDFIDKRLKDQYPILETQDYTLFELDDAIRYKDGIFYKAGKSYDLKSWKEDAFADVARQIMDKITNKYNPTQYDFVIFTGGGVPALDKYLSRYVKSDNVHTIDGKSQAANSIGYYIYAKYGN